jgi:hypothetical protein
MAAEEINVDFPCAAPLKSLLSRYQNGAARLEPPAPGQPETEVTMKTNSTISDGYDFATMLTMDRARYVVFRAPDRPTDPISEIGRYRSLRDAERAARRDVAGPRGSVGGCVPACAGVNAIDGYADRDGGQDATCAWVEHIADRGDDGAP